MDVFNERDSDIDLYTESNSRNGAKIQILLEELGLQYRLHITQPNTTTSNDRVKDPKTNLPWLSDVHPDGSTVRLFESGSIMQYLITRYDSDHVISYPKNSPLDLEVTNWLFFLTSRVSPNHGEAVHFSQEAPEKIPYGIERFRNETVRLYFVLDRHLAGTGADYIVGNKCTIADIAHFPWVAAADSVGIDLEKFPSLTAWYNRMESRLAVEKGMKLLESGIASAKE